ncbi:Tfp pilus assembly protein PilN [Eilatimonas milleporae]|uniref:Tfp pilus assembly protein PilN n=1 Tax=Eilatimonas milleporae TaxID=911205 RepID=A0A3M0CGU3_9PROT|nr:Tfp pilus assembly protein PilN [Eilatimonas milleporae]
MNINTYGKGTRIPEGGGADDPAAPGLSPGLRRDCGQGPGAGFAAFLWRWTRPSPLVWRVEQAVRWLATNLDLRHTATGPKPKLAEVPAYETLTLELNLPLAALGTLEDRIALEIEDRTPFHMADIAGAYSLEAGQEGGTLVCRAAVAPLNRLARHAQDSHDGLMLDMGPGQLTMRLNGRRRTPHADAMRARRTRQAVMALMLAGLYQYGGTLVTDRVAREADVIAARTTQARTAAEEAAALKTRLDTLMSERRRAADLTARHPSMVALLADVTAAMPDGAWAREIRYDGTRVTLSGNAPSAADILERLSGMDGVDNVAFGAPVSIGGDGVERFTVAFTPAPGPAATEEERDG